MGVNNSSLFENNEYICNKIISKTKIIQNDLTLLENNIESINIIQINNSYRYILNKFNDNNEIIINLIIILNEYIKNNFLIFDNNYEINKVPLINIESIEKYIKKDYYKFIF